MSLLYRWLSTYGRTFALFIHCACELRLRGECQNVPKIARVAAGAFGFLTLTQVVDGPERRRDASR